MNRCAACFAGREPIPHDTQDERAENSFLLALADAKVRTVNVVAGSLCEPHRQLFSSIALRLAEASAHRARARGAVS